MDNLKSTTNLTSDGHARLFPPEVRQLLDEHVRRYKIPRRRNRGRPPLEQTPSYETMKTWADKVLALTTAGQPLEDALGMAARQMGIRAPSRSSYFAWRKRPPHD